MNMNINKSSTIAETWFVKKNDNEELLIEYIIYIFF